MPRSFFCVVATLVLVLGLTAAAPTANETPTDNAAETVIGCLPSYELMPGAGCYKGYKLKVTWDTAERYCRVEGAHLAVAQSDLEKDAVLQLAKLLENGYPWAGIKNVGDRWVTAEGEEYGANGYTNWGSGSPGTLGSCAILADWGVGDFKCDDTYVFVCQQSLGRELQELVYGAV